MMWNRIVAVFLCTIAMLMVDVELSFCEDNNKTLIIYDSETNFGYTENVLLSVRELLYHYTSDIEVRNYKNISGGGTDSNGYNNIVILGIDEDTNFNDVGEYLSRFTGKIFWIGRGVESLLQTNGEYGFDILSDEYSFREVKYKDYKGNLGVKRGFPIIKVYGKKTKVLATINNSTVENPLIVETKNLRYMSRLDISGDNGDLFFILADKLYDFYGIKTFDRNMIYIRLEDVHPQSDIKKLREIGEFLYKRDIPFMIALIPVYVSRNNPDVTLSNVPEFVDTIKYLQELGGSIVLHGYTHQYVEYTTGEGFEFWDGGNDRPLNLDISKWVDNRLSLALDECVKNKIYPLVFEVPHYAVSQDGYKAISKYFSSIIGHIQNTDSSYNTTIYPFVLYDTDYGFDVIPENIGYYNPHNSFNLNEIKNNIDRLSIVRENLGGFFYHPYLGLDGLKEVVDIIDTYNYRYYDLESDDFTVTWSDNYIKLVNGKLYVSYEVEDEETDYFYWFDDGISILILFLGCIIVVQIVIYSRFRKKHRKRIDK